MSAIQYAIIVDMLPRLTEQDLVALGDRVMAELQSRQSRQKEEAGAKGGGGGNRNAPSRRS